MSQRDLSPLARAVAALEIHLRPGDVIWVEEGCGEPQTLTEALASVEIPDLTVVCGWTLRSPPYLSTSSRIHSLFGLARWDNGQHASGYIPVRYSSLPRLLACGALRVDAVLASVGRSDEVGRAPLSLQAGWLSDAIERARIVLLECNDAVPNVRAFPSLDIDDERIVVACETTRALPKLSQRTRPELAALGALASQFVPDDAVLQFGLGRGVKAILDDFRASNRRFQVHSGVVTDDVLDIHMPGKPVVTPLLAGTSTLFDWASVCPDLRGVRLTESHDLAGLAREECFVALNGASCVDLLGNVDAEDLSDGVRGAIGGHSDFALAAARSIRGSSIVALPARRADGRAAIVPAAFATTTKADVDVVVTEYGAADIRGLSLLERARAIVEIAHPDDRAELRRKASERRNVQWV